MFIIEQTNIFVKWFKSLKDPLAKISILKRIERAEMGNFGDYKSVGNGIYEMRITTGAGYRVYYAQKGDVIYLLLNGGNKSTQQADIEKAKLIWEEVRGEMK
ncbi:type II toxin-antitoxin system RelE/ParE family toxin [Aggregatibacter actinomycetemcomitans]|uniref:type II toxin-antitoxin system RelE/ParE family toxin n=1 Tax=Aggregatibacter actinomycetemcomitans TaxID=714 RepID=UPI00197C7726|nr:type II toxin-antitoxin system RelE/ParE family toxin [Aggregatibacter actinomycetemcomitans]MBN6064026.1 type II toxin-antitoxin system RelE/ParE family toxin [Aggregatibacter actinomycetemcomitans]MBN6082286.1 type II toxin-antitoxin system RelE/ParE family toxin [Aggregatibacter actinomycetemcomitans]MBN6083927.1 type II toxin-antitoxin system RelE/ParE family toxin [Aggregatibacter actinomycetemcomitans]